MQKCLDLKKGDVVKFACEYSTRTRIIIIRMNTPTMGRILYTNSMVFLQGEETSIYGFVVSDDEEITLSSEEEVFLYKAVEHG